MANNRRLRNLGDSEKAMERLVAAGSGVIIRRIDLPVGVTPTALERTIRSVAERVTHLRVQIEECDDSLRFMDTNTNRVRFEANALEPDRDSLDEAVDVTDLADRPLTLVYHQLSDCVARLTVVARHSLFDGKALSRFLCALIGESLGVARVAEAGLGRPSDRFARDRLGASVDSQLNSMMLRGIADMESSTIELPLATSSRWHSSCCVVDESCTAAVLNSARRLGLMPTSVFAAAALCAMASFGIEGDHFAAVTVDLRDELGVRESLGAYMGGLRAPVYCDRNTPLVDAASTLDNRFKQRMAWKDHVLAVLIQDAAIEYALDGPQANCLASVTVSNLGKSPLDERGIEGVFGGVPPFGKRPGVYVFLTSALGRLCITILAPESIANSVTPPDLLSQMTSRLQSFARTDA